MQLYQFPGAFSFDSRRASAEAEPYAHARLRAGTV